MATIKVKRGTRSEINTAASASGLNQGELYLITDENVLAVGTSTSNYEDVNSAGLVNSSSQLVVPSGGINFGTSTDGTGTVTSGILDDYEEGTFTPSFANFNINNGSVFGIYRKIGDMVTIYCGFTLGSTSSFSNTMHTIGGLPFTAITPTVNTENNINCLMRDVSSANYHGFARVQRGAATIAYPHADSLEAGSNLISSSTPFTWTGNDSMTVFGQYLAS